jgi:ferrous iron transport protein B
MTRHAHHAPIVVALAGNPNSGKTTLFNSLTGAHQHVGNYPGVTVERKEGHAKFEQHHLDIVDLPGTYSLTPYSLEELVARNFVVEERPDVVVDVVDATNLERNLYLATQFIELDVPVIIVLNMIDMAEAQGLRIDAELLGQLLGVTVIPMVATTGFGQQELLEAIVDVAAKHTKPTATIHFGNELEPHIAGVAELLDDSTLDDKIAISPRWLAIKLLENDAEVIADISEHIPDADNLLGKVARVREHVESILGEDAEITIGDRRYGFIAGACRRAVTTVKSRRIDVTDLIDDVVTNRIVGIPIFFLLMWLMFEMVFRLGEPPMGWIETGFDALGGLVTSVMPPGELRSLIVDGIIGGVGGVLVFVPNILLLFLAIAFIEDSGYMARAAFVVDKLMHKIGLHGKSFIPMLIGFGCTVPAVLACRTIDDEKNRLTTMLIAPLMSCSARLPVYLLLAGAFFPAALAGKVIFGVYIFGVLLAAVMALIFRKLLFPGETAPFVMELPPYRMPTLRGLLVHMWERTWMYVRKAGTVILVASVIVWALLTHPAPPPQLATAESEQQAASDAVAYSYAGRFSKALEPLISPLGFDWKIGTSLFAGFAAKEIVVSTLGTVYSLGDTDEQDDTLRDALTSDPNFDPLVALTLMVFVLIYVPCIAVVAVVKKETNSWKWPVFLIFYTTSLAWIVSFILYQGGRLLGF